VAALCGLVSLSLAPIASAAPSWWRVSNGHAEVWIIGAPRVTPRGFNWDTSTLERRLAATNTLIVGPQPRGVAAASAAGTALFALAGLRSPTPMEESLSPGVRRQFVAAREAIGQDARRYAGWKPIVAGKNLSDDFLKASSLQSGQVESRVRKLARSKGLSETPSGEVDPAQLITEVKSLGSKAQEACLAASVHDISIGADRLRALADAWAQGDVSAPPIDAIDRACLTAAPVFGAAFDRAAVQDSAAVAKALTVSPHGVAEFDLPTVVMPGGVLDRLRARGLQVSGPME
jgi:uncharacterized protein YbaP (TraB family)